MFDEKYETLDYQKGMAQAQVTWAWCMNPFDETDEHHCIDISHPKYDGTIIRLNQVGVIGDDPHPETGEIHPRAGRLYVDYDIVAVQLESNADKKEWTQEDKEEFEEVVEHIAIQILARDGLDRANNPKESIN
tara:strand:+ start:319 stop:717 length:399 start_codon:yes stop_codon:yes gene_type:complete